MCLGTSRVEAIGWQERESVLDSIAQHPGWIGQLIRCQSFLLPPNCLSMRSMACLPPLPRLCPMCSTRTPRLETILAGLLEATRSVVTNVVVRDARSKGRCCRYCPERSSPTVFVEPLARFARHDLAGHS